MDENVKEAIRKSFREACLRYTMPHHVLLVIGGYLSAFLDGNVITEEEFDRCLSDLNAWITKETSLE